MTQDLPDLAPLRHFFREEPALETIGKNLLKEGKVGSIALAGGHGSRLGYEAPKGCFPISPVHKKSLYQLLAERTLKASLTYGTNLPLAIMTSDATHDETLAHFEQANFFGLKKDQVSFFMQDNLPICDEAGVDLGLSAPNGNGALFWYFARSRVLDAWMKLGIQQIVVYTIDNALVDPYQPSLIGLNARDKNDVSIVGVEPRSSTEQVGLLVEKQKKVAVIEYSEIDETTRQKVSTLANISYFAFSLDFVQRCLTKHYDTLPLHKAKKKMRVGEKELWTIKREYFIFDLLEWTNRSEVLLLDRHDYFAPLKNRTGDQSIEMVQKQLEAHDRKAFYKMTGRWPPEDQPFELSPLYGII